MKQLMAGTAIALITGFGAWAQGAAPVNSADSAVEVTAQGAQDAQARYVPGFRASNFIGMSLYTLDPDRVDELRSTDATLQADPYRARWTSGPAFVSARDQWQDIGNIDDVVLSQDGDVRGVLLDIGGFLGIGTRTVMVSIDDLYFVADAERAESDEAQSIADFFVVASMSRDQLEALPEWSDEVLTTGFEVRDHALSATTMNAATMDAAPADAAASIDTAPDEAALPEQPTVADLTGVSVLDVSGDAVGTIEDLVLEGEQISAAIVDIGGFLGIGAHRVALPIDGLHIMRQDDGTAIDHVEVDMTKDQMEALPEHE